MRLSRRALPLVLGASALIPTAVLAGSDPFLLLPPSQALDERRIGMATAKRIVERHGGKIWLESQMQGGFAIRFTLSEASSSL